MVLGPDPDKGLTSPIVVVNIFDEQDEENLVAHFAGESFTPVPDVGETLSLDLSEVDSEGEIDRDDYGKYKISDKEYRYSLLTDRGEDEELPDRLFAQVNLYATPMD